MYTAIIVDDEPWSLIGIRNAFNWNSYGLEIVGEFTDSEEACDYIRNKTPDVVFTDIRMPKYSGIDLIRMARELDIDTEFVIISGFAEFSYAQEALKFGALDYCLKPIDIDKTDALLEKVRKHIVKKNDMKDNSILEALISNDAKEIIRHAPGFFDARNKFWYAIIVYTKRESGSDVKPEPFTELLNKQKYMEIKIGPGKMLYIINTNQDLVFRADNSGEFQSCGITSVGISRRTSSIKNSAKLIKEADIAALKVFVAGKAGLFFYEDKTSAVKPILNTLQKAIEQKTYKEIYELLGNIRKRFAVDSLGMAEVVHLWNQIIGTVIKYYSEEECCSGLEYLNYSEISDRFQDFDSLYSFLSEIFKQLELQSSASVNENEVIYYFEQLVKYIDGHYDQELYIRDLSARFYLNQFYCCRLFKKVLGKTFSEYVVSIRINKACQLIKNTDLSIKEIALKVGYADYFYFNKVFKKQCGTTPARYRKALTGGMQGGTE